LNVTVVDRTDAILEKARAAIDKSVRRIAKKKFADDTKAQDAMVEDVMKHITMTTDIPQSVKEADLVIEAIVENLTMKRNVFEQIEGASRTGTLLATNTSSISLAEIAANLKRKSNFAGLHFFNPVPVMKLLEVARYRETSDETFNTLMEFGKTIGKTTVSCKVRVCFSLRDSLPNSISFNQPTVLNRSNIAELLRVTAYKCSFQDTPGFIVNRLL
uniref:Hydroxyacyl-coenzyme A dehydrogenase, mitochondrial (inferred by orthology to a human protein) n=1 Tax=Anisakis simplex TaxID=6269 RepID=A0A0M3KEQ7_ANISI